jgi:membrane protease YdiL (CAAX protease family)
MQITDRPAAIEFRPLWRTLPFGIAGLTLALVAASTAMRAAAMFGPTIWRPLFMLLCIAMAILPWLVLSAPGRRQIGLRLPSHHGWTVSAALAGVAACALCFWLGVTLYGASADNWFVSISQNYRLHPTAGWSLLQLHLTFTIVAMLFSPIGEEIFFRGYLQKVLEQRCTAATSTNIQAALFALVHLCHHGILATAAGLVLLPGSGALWVVQMFALSLMLAWFRRRSDSLLPAIVAHATFNGAMNGFIFGYLWS